MDGSAEVESTVKFNPAEISKELDRLSRELSAMKEAVSETCVRAHKMELELAVMFEPEILETVRATKMDCDSCLKAIQPTESTDPVAS